MSEELKFIENSIKEYGVEELNFRMLPILKDALELYKMDNHYPSSLRDLYAYLTQAAFYKAYATVFEQVLNGVEPVLGNMEAEDLKSFGVTSNRYAQICYGSKKKMAVLVPRLSIKVCDYINTCLGWNKSAAMVYRSLTERILIFKLEKQLDTLLQDKRYSKHHHEIQT